MPCENRSHADSENLSPTREPHPSNKLTIARAVLLRSSVQRQAGLCHGGRFGTSSGATRGALAMTSTGCHGVLPEAVRDEPVKGMIVREESA